MQMRKFLLAGVAASMFAISACSDKGADADGDGKVSAAEAQKELSQGGAMAMKPGMWKSKSALTASMPLACPSSKSANDLGNGQRHVCEILPYQRTGRKAW
jgi:hypothetical protein